MTPNDVPPLREYTPEEMRTIFDRYRRQLTAEELMEYIEDDDEKYPIEQVLAEAEAMIRPAAHPEPGPTND